ncbi:MAG TPA: MaoC/PaaZ C-terminal domain-containing protein [Polyangia bacterium]|nr:MaoC/PaaZ C-terminal domain-containing protein [Polyangia bacterium]
MGLIRKEVVGKTYAPTSFAVSEAGIWAYAKSYGDERPEYRKVAPLLYAVVYAFDAGGGPLFDPALTPDPMKLLRRLVRGSLEIETFAPVAPGDVIQTQATIVGVQDKATGELLEIDTRSLNQHGHEVALVKNFHFIRGDSKGSPAPKAERTPINLDWESSYEVPARLPIEYAEASLDRNPIHTDDNFAKMAGFRGIILQGSATMAIAQRAIVDAVCGGDPRKLKQLRCRFAKPVYPGDVLTSRGSRLGAFETVNQEGVRVLDDGAFEAEGMNL